MPATGARSRGAGGDKGSAKGQRQGPGLGARGKERGRKRGQGTEASGSGGGQSAGSGRHDARQGAGKGQGHGKERQGRGQGVKEGGHGAQGVERGAVRERGRTPGHGHRHGKDTGASRAGQGAGGREQDPQGGQGDKGVGAGKGPKGKGKGAVGPRGQTGRGTGAARGGRSKRSGTGGGAPPQPDVQPVRCIPPGIQQMPAHHTDHHHHPNAHLYNIDPDAGDLIPPQTPRPQHQPAPPAPRAELARMTAASAAGGRDAAQAPHAQGLQGGPARGAEGARPWDRDWDTVSDPLGGWALPLVVAVYGWLSWACSGTTRGVRNRPFDVVLLWRDWGNQEVPPGVWAAPEDHEEGPLDGDSGGVARQGADVAVFPGGWGGPPHHRCGCQQLAPLGFAQLPHRLALPPAEPATAAAPASEQATTQVTAAPRRPR